MDARRAAKIEKYSQPIQDCREAWGCEVDYYAIVISSLEAILKETMDDLSMLLYYKKKKKKSSRYDSTQFEIWIKRMILIPIKRFLVIFYDLNPQRSRIPRITAYDAPEENEGLHNRLLNKSTIELEEENIEDTNEAQNSNEISNSDNQEKNQILGEEIENIEEMMEKIKESEREGLLEI